MHSLKDLPTELSQGFEIAAITKRENPCDVLCSRLYKSIEDLPQGARVLGPTGLEFTEEAIGDALATRALLDMLRQSGDFRGGPSRFARSDRSRFLSRLDELIHAARRDLRK